MKKLLLLCLIAISTVAYSEKSQKVATFDESQLTDIREPGTPPAKEVVFFGLRLGGALNHSALRRIGEDGQEIHQFAPDNAFRKFDQYAAFATPITHTIYEICAEGVFDDLQVAQMEFKLTVYALEKKHLCKFDSKDKADRTTAWKAVALGDDIVLISLLCSKQKIGGKYLLQLRYHSGRGALQFKQEHQKIMEWLQDIVLSKDDKAGL